FFSGSNTRRERPTAPFQRCSRPSRRNPRPGRAKLETLAVAVRRRLYNLVRRTTSQDTRNRLKRRMWRTRMRLAPIYRARYGTFGADGIRGELARHLPPDTEIVMVHGSLGGLEPMYTEEIRGLLDALIELCGTDRTLVMPAFFFGGRELDPIA